MDSEMSREKAFDVLEGLVNSIRSLCACRWRKYPCDECEPLCKAVRALEQREAGGAVAGLDADDLRDLAGALTVVGVSPFMAGEKVTKEQAEYTMELCRSVTAQASVVLLSVAEATPPAKVPDGLTARDRCVLRFALHRFMGEAYARHNQASQKTTAGLYASGAAERFYRDAKDAERLLSALAAAPAPKEDA